MWARHSPCKQGRIFSCSAVSRLRLSLHLFLSLIAVLGRRDARALTACCRRDACAPTCSYEQFWVDTSPFQTTLTTAGEPNMDENLQFDESEFDSQQLDETTSDEELLDELDGDEEPLDSDLDDLDVEDIEESGEEELGRLADLAQLVREGRTDEVLSRIPQIEQGLEKAVEGLEAFRAVQGTFKALQEGNEDALEAVDAFLDAAGYDLEEALERKGISLEAVLAARLGLSQSDISALLYGSENHNSAPDSMTSLVNRIERMERQATDTQWAANEGSMIADWVEQTTGRRYDPALLSQVRDALPTRGLTVEHVENAIMRFDPNVYRQAVRAASGRRMTLPGNAMVTKGGRAATTPTIELLDSPSAFAEHVKQKNVTSS